MIYLGMDVHKDSITIVDQHIGLDETDDGIWSIYFNSVLLATVDERDYIIRG